MRSMQDFDGAAMSFGERAEEGDMMTAVEWGGDDRAGELELGVLPGESWMFDEFDTASDGRDRDQDDDYEEGDFDYEESEEYDDDFDDDFDEEDDDDEDDDFNDDDDDD